ncbi:MAG: carbonic anhydrase [Chlamydiae bacterium]|nr:carbonic anhydrase [Chlamydiota bacterium]
MLRIARVSCLVVVLVLLGYGTFILGQSRSSYTSESSLQRLMEGNERFVEGKSLYLNKISHAQEISSQQDPFAVVICCNMCCSHSHVAPEAIFDQEPGSLAVIRVPGNAVGPEELSKIEFLTEKQHVPMIVVLGHQNCGAVRSVMQGNADETLHPHISSALEKAKGLPGDPVENAVKANLELVVDRLKSQPALSELIQKGQLAIQAGYYEVDKGRVELLSSLGNDH